MISLNYEVNSKLFTTRKEILNTFGGEFVDLKPNFRSSIYSNDGWRYLVNEIPSLKDSIISYLNKISNNNTKSIVVSYSGGIDSEIILYCAVIGGFNVTAITVDVFGTNIYDVLYAKKFCKRFNVKHDIITITKDEALNYYIPNMCLEVETPAYLLLGGYVVADRCFKDKSSDVVLISNIDPCQLVIDNGFVYFSEADYSLWTIKFNTNRGKEIIFDPMLDVNVFYSFVNSPLITERLKDCPYEMFFFDAKYLGKEYYYQDPDFKELSRRFSQHGWEKIKKSFGYTKEMVPDCNPDLKQEGAPFIKTYAAIEFINSEILKLDPDIEFFGWLQTNRLSPIEKFKYKNINTQVFVPTPPILNVDAPFFNKEIFQDYEGNILIRNQM